MSYQPTIGLEIHCELLTESKIFCECKNEFGGKPNSRVCPICTGFPATLPMLNKKAVELAVMAGIATDCTINNYSEFDRKNYFYPDLPKAYQITQFRFPICTNGYIDVSGTKRIRIKQIHLEEDAGKLVHDDIKNESVIDFNRCGVPLIEIVTEPDFHSFSEVQDFILQLSQRLKYSGVCDSKMEQGSLRVDVNISVSKHTSELGTRAEIKNLNSVKSIAKAIEYEIHRQSEILQSGGKVIQQTRRYDESSNITIPLRSKEELHDYRYFPEPDIPPLYISDEQIKEIRTKMPELPNTRLKRYTEIFKLSIDDAQLITAQKEFSDFYDTAVLYEPEYKLIAKLMLGEISHLINETGFGIANVKFTPKDIAITAKMVADGIISNGAAKEIIGILFYDGGNPQNIASEHGFIMDNNTQETEEIINKVLITMSDAVSQYRNGNEKVFGFIMGQVMRQCGKSANPTLIKQILTEKLK